MTDLDDPGLLALDASGMLRHIAGVGAEFVRAWEQSGSLVLPAGAGDATGVCAGKGAATANIARQAISQ